MKSESSSMSRLIGILFLFIYCTSEFVCGCVGSCYRGSEAYLIFYVSRVDFFIFLPKCLFWKGSEGYCGCNSLSD
jgi:hypothetical protein